MNESDRETGVDRFSTKLSRKQYVLLFGLMLLVFFSATLIQRLIFPADCRIGGALTFMLAGLPIYFGCVFLLPAWSHGGDRRVLLREAFFFLVVVFANLFALNQVECFLEGAWYATIVYMPVLAAVTYFLISRLMRITGPQIFPDGPPEDKAEKEGGTP